MTFALVKAGSAVNWSITWKQSALRINEESFWKSPQRNQSITLINSPPQQGAALINTGTKRIFLGTHGLSKEEPNVSSQSPSSVKSGSRSQPQWNFSRGQTSQTCPHLHLNTKTLLKHECIWTEKLKIMWWKSTLKDINEAAFPGSSLPHLIFRGRPTNFKFRSRRFSEICPGLLRTTSRLSRWITHSNPTTSWCHLQDIVRTDITSLKRLTD